MMTIKAKNFFDSILHDVIKYRQEKKIDRNDLIQYLIEVKRKSLIVSKGEVESDIITKSKHYLKIY